MEHTTISNTIEQPLAEVAPVNNASDVIMKDTAEQSHITDSTTLSNTDSKITDTISSEVIATCDAKVLDDGKPVVAELEKYHALKRELDHGEGDCGDNNGGPVPKRTCTEVAELSESQSGLEVFARSRMALCESLPYYRAYKSSLYTQDCIARGFYMDAAARDHDIFRAQVIISSVGGGRDLDEDKKRVRVGDMSDSSLSYRAIKKAMDARALIPVIVGRNHPMWPVDVQHNFNVLDYFRITDLWAELNVVDVKASSTDDDELAAHDEVKTIRVFAFRMEKVDLLKPSWWDHNPSSYARGPGAEKHSCASCGQENKQILRAGWTCLNYECPAFFHDANGSRVTDLTYCDAFLEERSDFIGPIPSLKPELTIDTENGIGLYGSEAVYRSGIVCTCGSCTSRVFWNRWSCENCGKEMRTTMVPYPMELVKAETELFDKTVARLRKGNHVPDGSHATKLDRTAVRHRDLDIGLYKASQFLLPDAKGKTIGSITVLRANETICKRGPNKMFDTLSVSDIGLRRNAVSGGHGANEGLSRHFGINWGAPYKFGVTVNSKGFSQAPETILQAVHQMRWASATAVPIAAEFMAEAVGADGANVEDANVNFNECLSLGYMEDDMIRYHDDGEKECGPTVATISLGAPAMMSFRPKKKSGLEDVVSHRPKAKGKEFSAVLSFPLYHGDITIMHGSRIHGLYEHQVEPAGGRRFALTCRYMDPARMKTDEERLKAKIDGAMPAHAEKYAYHGDGFLTVEERATSGTVTPPATPEHAILQVAETCPIAEQCIAAMPNVLPAITPTVCHDSTTASTTAGNQADRIDDKDLQQNDDVQAIFKRYNLRERKVDIVYKDADTFDGLD